jgi:hypothetical protein
MYGLILYSTARSIAPLYRDDVMHNAQMFGMDGYGWEISVMLLREGIKQYRAFFGEFPEYDHVLEENDINELLDLPRMVFNGNGAGVGDAPPIPFIEIVVRSESPSSPSESSLMDITDSQIHPTSNAAGDYFNEGTEDSAFSLRPAYSDSCTPSE